MIRPFVHQNDEGPHRADRHRHVGPKMRKALFPGLSEEVADGTRTRDHRDHNPGLYQLSYRHRAETQDTAGYARPVDGVRHTRYGWWLEEAGRSTPPHRSGG